MDSMRMIIAWILLLLINGTNCLKNGIPVDPSLSRANFVATVWRHEPTVPQLLCTGTIITLSHIVTAGHCVHSVRNYEIYVTAEAIDPNAMMSLMVHQIYLHANFGKISNFTEHSTAYWVDDIAILHLVYELSMEFSALRPYFRKYPDAEAEDCYILGWNSIAEDGTSSIALQMAKASILGMQCSLTEGFLLMNERHFFLTTVTATLEDTDIGNALICNRRAMGIIVRTGPRDRTHGLFTVLSFVPHKSFIQYIISDGVTQVKKSEFRGVVSIWESDQFRCGGFRFNERHVITAAHCVDVIQAANLLVIYSPSVPSIMINAQSERSLVEKIEIHPHYEYIYDQNLRKYSRENDIAVLKLGSDLSNYKYIQLADFPDLSQISVDIPCEIFRWTRPFSGHLGSKILTKSLVTILDSERSGELGYHLRAGQFLVEGFYALPIATNVDVGNPIIYNQKVIGIVIAVSTYPDPVTCLKILPYQDFIHDVIS